MGKHYLLLASLLIVVIALAAQNQTTTEDPPSLSDGYRQNSTRRANCITRGLVSVWVYTPNVSG